MDPKRKRLYIIVIAACVMLSVGVWLWGRSTTPTLPQAGVTTAPQTTAKAPSTPQIQIVGDTKTYAPPPVFPANRSLDPSVLDSSAYKLLQPYQPLELGPADLGREDPFGNY